MTLKEGRPLVVCPREAPLSTIHLRNMLALAELQNFGAFDGGGLPLGLQLLRRR